MSIKNTWKQKLSKYLLLFEELFYFWLNYPFNLFACVPELQVFISLLHATTDVCFVCTI